MELNELQCHGFVLGSSGLILQSGKKTAKLIAEAEFIRGYIVNLGRNHFGILNDWDIRDLAPPSCLELNLKYNLTICFIFLLGLKAFSWSLRFTFPGLFFQCHALRV